MQYISGSRRRIYKPALAGYGTLTKVSAEVPLTRAKLVPTPLVPTDGTPTLVERNLGRRAQTPSTSPPRRTSCFALKAAEDVGLLNLV